MQLQQFTMGSMPSYTKVVHSTIVLIRFLSVVAVL
jgi:hypothetical protein